MNTKISAALRQATWNEYIGPEVAKGTCFCCGLAPILPSNFECGHVIARKYNGPTRLPNMRPVCSICNKSMGCKNLIKFALDNGFTHHVSLTATTLSPECVVTNKEKEEEREEEEEEEEEENLKRGFNRPKAGKTKKQPVKNLADAVVAALGRLLDARDKKNRKNHKTVPTLVKAARTLRHRAEDEDRQHFSLTAIEANAPANKKNQTVTIIGEERKVAARSATKLHNDEWPTLNGKQLSQLLQKFGQLATGTVGEKRMKLQDTLKKKSWSIPQFKEFLVSISTLKHKLYCSISDVTWFSNSTACIMCVESHIASTVTQNNCFGLTLEVRRRSCCNKISTGDTGENKATTTTAAVLLAEAKSNGENKADSSAPVFVADPKNAARLWCVLCENSIAPASKSSHLRGVAHRGLLNGSWQRIPVEGKTCQIMPISLNLAKSTTAQERVGCQ